MDEGKGELFLFVPGLPGCTYILYPNYECTSCPTTTPVGMYRCREMYSYNDNLLQYIYHNLFLFLLQTEHFVTRHRARLIQRVYKVMPIVDSLGSRVHPEIYAEIKAETTTMKQIRRLYDDVLTPGGRAVREAFYDALKQHQPDLLESLGKIGLTDI